MAESKNPKGSSGKEEKEEEIDMGVFLTLLGRGISRIFDFIRSIFTFLFNGLILFLVFLRANFTKIVLVTVVAGIIGSIYQYALKDKVFESSMTVQPNFGSTVQLYKNIDLYSSLIKQKDYERLSKALDINLEEAQNITDIEVYPYDTRSQSVLAYMDFVSTLDSSAVDLIDYETFSDGQADESFKYHVVNVRSKDKLIFTKIEDPIINSVTENNFYNKIKETSYLNLVSKKIALETSMAELDSLRSLYGKVLLAESIKESSGTSIYMSEVGGSTKEMVIFEMYLDMNQQLIDVNEKLTREIEVINVLSSFNPIGTKVRGWYRNFALLGFVGGFVMTLLILFLINLNSILKKHSLPSQNQPD